MKRLLCSIVLFGLVSMVFGIGEINIAYSPYTISKPGSYIVVKDLKVPVDQIGISVVTSNVSIDLNGHTIYGAGTSAGSFSDGIYSDTNQANVSVFNGSIRDFRDTGLEVDGVNANIHHINSMYNMGYGILLGGSGILKDNNATFNNGPGIIVSNAVVRENVSSSNNGEGITSNGTSTITENVCSYNKQSGIYSGYGTTITNNSVYGNGGYGIRGSNGNTIEGNTVFTNGADGIFSGYGNIVMNNSCYQNSSTGINLAHGSIASGNTVSINSTNGIFVSSQCKVMNNNCYSNGYGTGAGSGIYVNSNSNTIENNLIVSNDTGLYIGTSGNIYIGNILRGNSVDTVIIGGNTNGDGVNGGFKSIIIPNSQPNYLVEHIMGMNIPVIQESKQATLRNLVW